MAKLKENSTILKYTGEEIIATEESVDRKLLTKASKTDIPTKLSQLTKDIDFDERYYTETEVNTKLDGKVDNSRVLTDVPANAKFTDTNTITTINGKTGAISKADIVALGIPASDTNTTYEIATTTSNGLMSSMDKTKLNGIATGANKYTHPSTHPYSMITGTPTSMEPTYTAIPSNADLNDYTEIGFYGTASSGVGSTILNKPTEATGFTLIVAKRGSCTTQILIDWLLDSPYMWIRSYSAGWGKWYKVPFDRDIPTKVSQLSNDEGYLTKGLTWNDLKGL